MAKRNIRRQNTPKRKPSKKRSSKTNLMKAVAGLGALIILVIIAGVLARHLLLQKHPIKPVVKPRATKIPRFEIYPEKDVPPHKPIPKPVPAIPKELPKIAIIIDDIGYDKEIVEKLLGLDAVFTFSILPYSPFQKSIARSVHSKGFDVMLHLPMEPNEYPMVNPGPGALLTSMSPDQLIKQLDKDLDSVPFIQGVNNHMGSKMTTVSIQLYQIFSVLKKRKLFFIDSRTTTETLCKPSAQLLQVPFAQKDVFLDHIQERDFIRKQIYRLIHIANSHGEAIGIAHPHDVTYDVLREVLPELKKKAILVRASDLVHVGT
ncbi:MAG: divergent polysaccharide deacetylase family protein [Deltaproteobacteria bacterium]|nr:divergent polysaccharide deacetylase family protein [Deltaproteobacteria bacterium]